MLGFLLILSCVVVIRYVVLNMCMLIILYNYELESRSSRTSRWSRWRSSAGVAPVDEHGRAIKA